MGLYRCDQIHLDIDADEHAMQQALQQRLGAKHLFTDLRLVKRAIDARRRSAPHWVVSLEFVCQSLQDEQLPKHTKHIDQSWLQVSRPPELRVQKQEHVIIVGAGPAGLFAALSLAEAGVKVTLLERGKAVEQRMRDIGALRSKGKLDPESNLCFGEGGAGTYTDGKLYTRIKHPYQRWVLAQLVQFGAAPQILIDAHPHLGSDKLLRIVKNIRQHLLKLDVTIRFSCKMTRILQKQGQTLGVELSTGEQIFSKHVILAIGHSARDTLTQLLKDRIPISPKPFAVGVRAEHPQALINQIQYRQYANHQSLGAAAYQLKHQSRDAWGKQRGIYSFCMCPGGLIMPSATEAEHMAINGMSNAKRSSPYANAGIVVEVRLDDLQRHGFGNDALAGIRLQRSIESRCYHASRQAHAAIAMRLNDYVNKRSSGQLAASHYRPALEAGDLHQLLPTWINAALCEGLQAFERKMPGYISDQANLLACETRTSSPLRIERDQQQQSIGLKGLYPTGEGAGYAGGIVSAAVDGIKSAAAILTKIS